jgi:hypothetical protein
MSIFIKVAISLSLATFPLTACCNVRSLAVAVAMFVITDVNGISTLARAVERATQ